MVGSSLLFYQQQVSKVPVGTFLPTGGPISLHPNTCSFPLFVFIIVRAILPLLLGTSFKKNLIFNVMGTWRFIYLCGICDVLIQAFNV